jgi:hypothetical protein
MKKIIKEKTTDFPSFEIEGNTLKLVGAFIPENDEFFEEIKKELEKIQKLIVKIHLFNGLSKRFLRDLLEGDSLKTVYWHYPDKDILEIGKIFSELYSNLNFIFIKSFENPKLLD